MRSSKSRSRNKNRNRNNQGGGNIVNRVFDSSGPEGKVRGTPAQIIEKYNQLARDAQLSGDRVAVENFQQHSEHYTRMLAAAQKEIDARQAQHNQNQQNNNQQNNQQGGNQNGGQPQNNQQGNTDGANQQGGQNGNQQGGNRRRDKRNDQSDPRPDAQEQNDAPTADVIDTPEADSGPVDTPETAKAEAPKAEKPKRTRTRKKAPAKAEAQKTAGETGELPAFIDPAEPAAEG